MTKQLDLADAQFIGFAQGKCDGRIIDLVTSMGLTKKEWDNWKKGYSNVLCANDFNDVENHFNETDVE
jgi:hypothetical protein